MKYLKYPLTPTVHHVDKYFGSEINDPYRWLEDHNSPEVRKWVDEQSKFADEFLDSLPGVDDLQKKLAENRNYERQGIPFETKDFILYSFLDGNLKQPIIKKYYKKTKKTSVFIDTNKLESSGNITFDLVSISKDQRYVVVSKNSSGSDWETFLIFDLYTNEQLSDELNYIKFSTAAWRGNGFFYKRYPKPPRGEEFTFEHHDNAIYYHRIGDTQSDDELIYSLPDQPKNNLQCQVTSDQKYLVIYNSEKEDGFETIIKNLDEIDSNFVKITTGFEYKCIVLGTSMNSIIALNNIDADNYKIDKFEINDDIVKSTNLVPQRDLVVEEVSLFDDILYINYLKNASSCLVTYNIEEDKYADISLPTLGNCSEMFKVTDDSSIYLAFSSFTYPTTIYEIKDGKLSEFFRPQFSKLKMEDFETSEVFYKSLDGTLVHMFLVGKKNFRKKPQPTYLYAYGGFNISLTPSFSPALLTLINEGVLLAIPNLRGGGEYGEDWHRAGMLLNKQNVFDDFVFAARYLIENKVTTKDQLCIAGGSNGGLLVGAVLNQKTDMFGCAIAEVGVMDMLRFHKFTEGWGWTSEYGCSDNKQDFENLIKYSPYHNIKSNIVYPPILIKTADHDDRVVPLHSYKYSALLQNSNPSNIAILSIDKDSGHGSGATNDMINRQYAQKWAFVINYTKKKNL